MRTKLTGLLLSLATLITPALPAAASARSEKWKLVWQDEFNGRALSAKKWNVLIREHRPWYSEIDIMEFPGHETNVIYGTLHYHTFEGQKRTSSGKFRGPCDYTRDFHIYALEWEPDEMRWFVDGQMIHSRTKGIPHTPRYLILNTAVGGAWPGNPEVTTVFPQFHVIDYVRVYQRPSYFKH